MQDLEGIVTVLRCEKGIIVSCQRIDFFMKSIFVALRKKSDLTDGNIKTLGSVSVEYMGHPVTLQVVKNDFPISQEGILGSDFLRNTLVANCNGRAFTGAVNTGEVDREIEIPMMQLEEVETISARRPNSASLSRKNVLAPRSENSNGETHKHTLRLAPVSTKNVPKQERACRVKSLLRLDHLNDEEESHVDENS